MCEQDFACHVPSAPSPGDCDQLSAAHNSPTLDDCDQGSRLIIAIVRMSSKPATSPSAHNLLQNLPHSLTVDVQVFYAVEPGDRSPGSYVNNQDDEHGMTKSNLTPHKDLVLHMMYDDPSVTRVFRCLRQQIYMETFGSRVGDFDRTGKSEGDRLSDYFEVLGTQTTSEIASKRGGRTINNFQKEILIVVSDMWSDSSTNTILKVGSSPLWLRSCFRTISRHALNSVLL